MKMTTEDRRLLADVIRWARANGWEHQRRKYADACHEWLTTFQTVVVDLTAFGDAEVQVYDTGRTIYTGWPRSVREAVDVLAALGVIPVELSSAYRAGRASADLVRRLADELEEMSRTYCWSGQYPSCVNGGCVDRAALIAEAREHLDVAGSGSDGYPDAEARAAIEAACTCAGCMTGGRCAEDPSDEDDGDGWCRSCPDDCQICSDTSHCDCPTHGDDDA